LLKLGTEKPRKTTSYFSMCFNLRLHQGITSGDGRCFSEWEVASSNKKGVFLGDGSAKGLRRFCTYHKETLFFVQNVGSRLEVLGNRTEISSEFHQEQAEVGIWSSEAMLKVQTSCQDPMTQGGGDCVGSVLKGSAYTV
jgi:hypothetical protein